ncbi:adenine nucleotide alpha hydrolase family protein [Pedobacter metabolipauper]|uniref:Phosphoadenosine phosphosulfate reductase family protein n=1 Tax=Pedobacter metabolipauper TaxID=425513 RepID=A0A4R6T0E6_9SPHI|nr:hypothetical protein [Pedobacter metabolipauper]TDQ12206.1 hypothetical protein ATK78_1340 [Pedobacter metabolipauper]
MTEELTFFSFGGGQDGTYMLYKMIRDQEYKKNFVKGRLVVAMSDPGDEHEHTYQHVYWIEQLCKENGIEFYFLKASDGFHPNTWQSLISQFRLNNTIMSMMFGRSCTDNLKIKPLYNFLNVWIAREYYGEYIPNSTRNRTWIKRFAKDHSKIKVIIGIASGEEKRIKISKKKSQFNLFKPVKSVNVWMTKSIEKVYPMITEGIDRKMAQDYILVTPWPLPYPSNCMRCPFLSLQEILWLFRFHPDKWYEWVEIEQNKIDANTHVENNLGVKGKKLLPEILKEAIEKFGHLTDQMLTDYKMSHGHCVKSKY